MSRYKISLYRYVRVKGYEEEHIFANFDPAKVDGFGVILGKHNSAVYEKKYTTEGEDLTKP